MPQTIIVTGASGLLGRAIFTRFQRDPRFCVIGICHSRTGPGLMQLDLRDGDLINKMVEDLKPSLIIHAAAERRPDVVEKDVSGADLINVEAVWFLGRASSRVGAEFIQISTDYLWDGTEAPYSEDAKPCPLNAYGRSKLRGEYAALASHAEATVLRVPVLFGPTTDLMESAVSMFAGFVADTSKKHVSIVKSMLSLQMNENAGLHV